MQGMITALNLDRRTVGALDDLVASGRFASREDAVREGLRLVQEGDAQPPGAAEMAGLERGLVDVAAGDVISSVEVRTELERRHAAES